MWHTTSSRHHRTVSAATWVVAALWIVAGVATAMAMGGGFTRVAALLAIVIAEWWIVSQLEDRFEGNVAGTRAPADQRGPKQTPARAVAQP
jgi:ABC-type nickel/cobalt efflux system permease component RcnA